MCDPVSLSVAAIAAGAGSSLYGSKLQQDAANKVDAAQAEAIKKYNASALALQSAERERQRGYTNQSTSVFNESLKDNSADSQAAQEAALRSSLAGQYGGAADKAADYSNIPGMLASSGDENKVIADNLKNVFGGVKNYLGQQAGSKAALDAYGNLSFNQNQANARQLQNQSILGNFMQGSSNVLANELSANKEASDLAYSNAQNVGNGLLQQAALFNGLGQIGTSIGAAGIGGVLGGWGGAAAGAGAGAGSSMLTKAGGTPNAIQSFTGTNSFGAAKPFQWNSLGGYTGPSYLTK